MSTAAVLARTSRAEWSRIWSVRSSWLFALVLAVVVVGFGTIVGAESDPSQVDPGDTAWDGGRMTGMFALFGVVALAVVTATADHTTGGIVPTLQWTPRRGALLAARVLTIVLTTTLLGLVLITGASTMIVLFLPELGLPLGDGARTLGDLGFVLACGAGLGVGLGLLTRSTAAALVAALALLLVLPLIVAQLPYDWTLDVAARLPGSGALFLIFGEGPRDDMTVASARLTLALWAVGALVLGGWRLLRSDANR